MAQYGQLLNSSYNPQHDELYSLMVKYFNNPEMVKIRDTNGYSMYMAKTNSLLLVEYHYIIAFVYHDNKQVGYKERLSELKWSSLQTRTLREDHKLSVHDYIPTRMHGLDKKITLVNSDNNQYNYKVDGLPITITLLPSGKQKGIEYNTSGTVITALETYQTIVVLT